MYKNYYFLNLYISSVVGNRITKSVLMNLDEQLITDLIPLIGDRSIFLTYLKQNYKEILSKKDDISRSSQKKIVCNFFILYAYINTFCHFLK